MQPCPHRALGEIHDHHEDEEEDHHPRAQLVAFLELGLGRPHQISRDVTRVIVERRLGPVGIADHVIAQRRRHGDLMPREGGIVVHALRHLETGRRRMIAGEQRVDIVGSARPRLGHHRQVRRQRTVIGDPRQLIVGERRAERIRRPRRALEHLAFVVRAVGDLHLRGENLHRLRRELRSARLAEIAVGQKPHRMAARADLLVDLEAALQLRVVVGPEWRGEAPALMRDLRRVI